MLEKENTVMETGSTMDDFQNGMDENTASPHEKTESTDENTPSSSPISTTESKTNPGVLKKPSEFPRPKQKKKVRFADIVEERVIVHDRFSEIPEAVKSYIYEHNDIISKHDKCICNIVVMKHSSKELQSTDGKFNLFKKPEKVKKLWKREDSVQSQIVQQLTPATEPNETNSLGFDYTYEQLLSRCHRKTKKNTSENTVPKHTTKPSVYRNVQPKFIVPPPKISILPKKTVFSNINYMCKFLRGVLKHMALIILSELEAPGYVDSGHQLVICRSVNQQQIESAVRRYIIKYVRCSSCKSLNTFMSERTRHYIQTCKKCKAKCSILKMKSTEENSPSSSSSVSDFNKPRPQAVTRRRETMKSKIVASLIFILLHIPYFYLCVLPLHHLFIYNKFWMPFVGVITF